VRVSVDNQATLFAEDKVRISIPDAARDINVSDATIRNWIKTGLLEQSSKNHISISSINALKENVIGNDKLVLRANKSLKDNHNHDGLTAEIIAYVNDNSLDSNLLGAMYQDRLSDSYKNLEGIYYTPQDIVERFFETLPSDCSNLSFFDPCCGSGNFLVGALKKGFKPENIYGSDIDSTALEIAKRRFREFAGKDAENLKYGNFFENCITGKTCYDVIITNPPWGKKIDKNQKEQLNKALKGGASKDTSAIFLFGCLNLLKPNGTLGLLLQDAFFNIDVFADARVKSLEYELKELIDFGKPFKGLLTKAKGIVLKKSKVDVHKNEVLCQVDNKRHFRKQSSFTENPKVTLNFSISQTEAEIIKHIYSKKHVLLANNAVFGLGVVTGNNSKHCSPVSKENYVAAYRGSEIHRNRLDTPASYLSKDFSQYQQVAPLYLYEAEEKLIYRFISSDLVFFHDKNQSIILNSANMLILNKNFPISYTQLCDLLNSKVMNWLFKSLFDTHKVLRSDIESLPIHAQFFNKNPEFSEANYLDYLGIEEVLGGTYRIKEQNL
jgi:site-specific DNA-methyltransferase (adenine-specific)